MINLPNALTLLRFVLVPLIAWRLLAGDHATAFWLFLVAATSDIVDGAIARRWHLETRFGAVADPLADKLTMFTTTLLLAWQQALPWGFAIAVIARDLVIVGGALAYRNWVGRLEMAPTRISKANTGLQFLVLLGAMATRSGMVPGGDWFDGLLLVTIGTIVVSGAQYVVEWGARAWRSRRPPPRS